MATLIARVTAGVERTIDWIGTVDGRTDRDHPRIRNGSPIRKLVLNDAGMLVPKAALEQLGATSVSIRGSRLSMSWKHT